VRNNQEMSQSDAKPIRLFYSYSHRDEALRDELERHLASLRRRAFIQEWHDRKISAGREWENAIDTNLETANIILLLISSDFLDSDYCYDKEMKRALEKHEAGEARVIPVIIRDVDWHDAPFGKLQALPKDAKPVTSWSNQDEAWSDVARGIRKVVEELAVSPLIASSTIYGTQSGRYWNVRHPANLFFTGREDILLIVA
jgi:hypothetical protein